MRWMPFAAAPVRGTCCTTTDAMVSFDEHTIPRWTRKFHIGKGYVTTRNKYMRCEKLFTGLRPGQRPLPERAWHAGQLQLARPGGAAGRSRCCVRASRSNLHALFDAGAGKSDAGVRALWDLAEQHPNLDVTLRACRYPHRMRAWKQLPSGLFVSVEEPGVCVGAPPKEVRLAETQTVLKDEAAGAGGAHHRLPRGAPGSEEGPLASVVHDEYGRPEDGVDDLPGPAKPRARPSGGGADLLVDAVPCGYDKDSPDRKRPRFHRGPLQMIGWLVALVYNAVADLAAALGPDHVGRARADPAAEVLQPTGTVVRNARGLDRVPGPISRVRTSCCR